MAVLKGFLALPVFVSMAMPALAQDQSVTLGSGLHVSFLDQILEQQVDGENWLTLRFVSTDIGEDAGELGYEQVASDLDLLCEQRGLAAADGAGDVDQVIITLMDRAVERGASDPDATIYIGAYAPTEEGCVWQ